MHRREVGDVRAVLRDVLDVARHLVLVPALVHPSVPLLLPLVQLGHRLRPPIGVLPLGVVPEVDKAVGLVGGVGLEAGVLRDLLSKNREQLLQLLHILPLP